MRLPWFPWLRRSMCMVALYAMCGSPWEAWRTNRGALAKRRTFSAELGDAQPLQHNGFKIELAARTITAVLSELSEAQA